MKRNHLFFTLMLAMTASVFVGCHKHDDDDGHTHHGEGDLAFHFEYKVGSAAFTPGQIYTINGVAVQIDIANFYLGGIRMKDHDGSETAMEGKYLLVKPDATHHDLGKVAKGHVHELHFFVGVEEAINGQTTEDFTSRSASDPLSIQHPAMHWNWNTGYRFVRIDGKVDTNGDGSPDANMSFHLGTNPLLRHLAFTTHTDLDKDQNEIAFTFDLAKLFAGVDLATEYSTHTNNNRPLADKVADNLAIALTQK